MLIVFEARVWNGGSYLGPESLWAWGSWTNAMRLGDSCRRRWEGKWHFCTGWLAGKQQPKRRLGCQEGNFVFQFSITKKKSIKTCSTKCGQGHALVGILYLLIGIEISTMTWPIFCSVFLTYIIYCIDLSVLGLTCDMRYFRSFLQHVRSFSCCMQDL